MTKPAYKMTEIGEIPEDWNLDKISNLIKSIYYGITAKSTDQKSILRFLRTTDIKNFRFSEKDLPYCKITESKQNLSKYYLKKGDIIVARAGTVGVSVLVKRDLPNTIFGSYLIKIIFNEQLVDLNFIHCYLQSPIYWDKLEAAQGSTIKNINIPFIKGLLIPIPPLPEQKKIAEILSTADGTIQKVNEEITLTEKLKKGLMNTLLTKGIRHTKFKMTELGEIPEEWKIGSLASLSENENGIVAGPFGSNLKVSDYTNMGIPIIRLQNIASNSFIYKDIKYISEGKAEELNYHSFIAGDIVLAKLGDPIGVSCIIPPNLPRGIVVADVVRIRVSKKKVDKRFVVQSLNSPICLQQLKSTKIGSTRPRVNLSDVRDMKMILPDLQEQEKIAEILSAADNKLELLRNKKKYLERIKKGLMNDLLTGKVRVNINTSEGEN